MYDDVADVVCVEDGVVVGEVDCDVVTDVVGDVVGVVISQVSRNSPVQKMSIYRMQ